MKNKKILKKERKYKRRHEWNTERKWNGLNDTFKGNEKYEKEARRR